MALTELNAELNALRLRNLDAAPTTGYDTDIGTGFSGHGILYMTGSQVYFKQPDGDPIPMGTVQAMSDLSDVATVTPTDRHVVIGNGTAFTSRALVDADMPVVGASKGGTGISTYAKGDLLVSPGSNLLSKLSVGSDGQVLTLDSAQALGIKWADGGGGGGGLTENRWRVGGAIRAGSPGNGDITTGTVEGFATTGRNYDPETFLTGGSNSERITIQASGTYHVVVKASVFIDDVSTEMVEGDIIKLIMNLWHNDGSSSIADTMIFSCPYKSGSDIYYFPPLATSLVLDVNDYLFVDAGLDLSSTGSAIETEIAIDEWSGHQIAPVPA